MATRSPARGGYDYDFFDLPPGKTLECPICLLTLRDPHVVSCCGNEFCQACIGRVQSGRKPCPLCNQLNFTTLLHKKLVREVNSLSVRCPHKDLGCQWVGELGQLDKHLNVGSSSDGCGYEIVDCDYRCGARVQRHKIEDHKRHDCPKHPITSQIASLIQRVDALSTECTALRQEVKSVKEENQTLRLEICEIRAALRIQTGKKEVTVPGSGIGLFGPAVVNQSSFDSFKQPSATTTKSGLFTQGGMVGSSQKGPLTGADQTAKTQSLFQTSTPLGGKAQLDFETSYQGLAAPHLTKRLEVQSMFPAALPVSGVSGVIPAVRPSPQHVNQGASSTFTFPRFQGLGRATAPSTALSSEKKASPTGLFGSQNSLRYQSVSSVQGLGLGQATAPSAAPSSRVQAPIYNPAANSQFPYLPQKSLGYQPVSTTKGLGGLTLSGLPPVPTCTAGVTPVAKSRYNL